METINKRMKRAAEESQFMGQYDYITVNDVLDDCVEDMHATIEKASQCLASGVRYKAEQDFGTIIKKIQEELKEL